MDRQTDRQTELPWHIRAIAYMLSRVIKVQQFFNMYPGTFWFCAGAVCAGLSTHVSREKCKQKQCWLQWPCKHSRSARNFTVSARYFVFDMDDQCDTCVGLIPIFAFFLHFAVTCIFLVCIVWSTHSEALLCIWLTNINTLIFFNGLLTSVMKTIIYLSAVDYDIIWLVVADIIPKKIKYSDYLELMKKGQQAKTSD